MRIVTAHLVGVSTYSQSKKFIQVKGEKESHDAFERRVWRTRCSTDREGFVVIPAMALKSALSGAAKYLSLKIPGKRNATYTKHFEAGVLVLESPRVRPQIKAKDLEHPGTNSEALFQDAQGKKGSKSGGTKVLRIFPIFPVWECLATYHILDETIDKKIFTRILAESGNFIGIGRWRPENAGIYGRYMVKHLDWSLKGQEVPEPTESDVEELAHV